MKYGSTGKDTSESEVTDISPFGIWLLHKGKEYFLSYVEFPWFKNATVQQIFSVQDKGDENLRWAELDVDLSIETIRDPGTFPLVYEPKSPYGDK